MNKVAQLALAATALTAVTLIANTAETAKLPAPAERKDVTFADIKPIFDKSCVECHGPKKQKGDLRLDNREATLKGGEDGSSIKVGDSANSDLVKLVARIGDEEDWMPPIDKGKPLTTEQVALIRAWIDQGAK